MIEKKEWLKPTLLLCMLIALISPAEASESNMLSYTINLPNHKLGFALPSKIASSVKPENIESNFSIDDPSFIKNKFRIVAKMMHDINAPLLGGAYGSLKFSVIIKQHDPTIKSDISTIDGLEAYINEWSESFHNAGENYIVSRVELNGMPAIRREQNSFGNQKRLEPSQVVIFSLPLNNEIFVDIVFTIKGWKAGRYKESQWKPKAESLQNVIMKNVTLRENPQQGEKKN